MSLVTVWNGRAPLLTRAMSLPDSLAGVSARFADRRAVQQGEELVVQALTEVLVVVPIVVD